MLTRSAVIETLGKSNRLFDVASILHDIIEHMEGYGDVDLPVHPCIDDNKLITHVKSKDVYSEARHLFEMLSSLSIPDDSKESCVGSCMYGDEYSNLFLYVRDYSNMLLHNYAVEVSHRMGGEMNDEIRVWCILSNLLDNIYSDEWDVPAGWCRKE